MKTKHPYKVRLDELDSIAQRETETYEPRYRKSATCAFIEGFLYCVQMLKTSESDNN